MSCICRWNMNFLNFSRICLRAKLWWVEPLMVSVDGCRAWWYGCGRGTYNSTALIDLLWSSFIRRRRYWVFSRSFCTRGLVHGGMLSHHSILALVRRVDHEPGWIRLMTNVLLLLVLKLGLSRVCRLDWLLIDINDSVWAHWSRQMSAFGLLMRLNIVDYSFGALQIWCRCHNLLILMDVLLTSLGLRTCLLDSILSVGNAALH